MVWNGRRPWGRPPVPSGVYADNRLYDAGMLSAPRMHPTDGAQLATATSMPPATTGALATAAAAVGAPAPAPVAAQPAAALGGASAAPGSAESEGVVLPSQPLLQLSGLFISLSVSTLTQYKCFALSEL